jgi:hypothetical protein
MVDGSSTGGGGEYYADAAVNAEAIHQSMAKAAQSIQTAAGSLSTFSAETLKIKEGFQDIGSQVILDPAILDTSKEFEKAALNVVKSYGRTQKHAGAIVKLNQQIADLETKIGSQKGKQAKESKKLLDSMKKISKEYKSGTTQQARQAGGFKKGIEGAKKYAGAVTGLNISIMGVIAMIIDTVNIMRKINAYAKAGAAHLGDGAKAVNQTRSAMFGLRRDFHLAFDEAGKIVNAITAMGFEGEQVAGKAPILKDLKKVEAAQIHVIANHEAAIRRVKEEGFEIKKGETYWQAQSRTINAMTDEMYNIGTETEKLAVSAKKITATNNARIKAAKQQISLTSELYAIERKYGIQVAKTGNVIKSLQQDYGATHMAARDLLGVAIQMGTTLREEGVPIGIEEVIEDWSKLIDKTRVYKTDLLGILGLYNTMIKKDIAKSLGLGGVAKSVKTDIAKTLTSMSLDMEFGWKARIGMRAGLGKSVAEAGLAFEKLGPMEKFGAVVKELTFMVGDVKKHPYEAEFRGRELFQKVGFTKESAIELTRAVVSQKLTAEEVEKRVREQAKQQKEMLELQKKWKEGRVKLVNTAGSIARGQTEIKTLIKQWIENKIMAPLMDIYNAIAYIAAWFEGGKAQVKIEYKNFGKQFAEDFLSAGAKPAMGTTLASQAFTVFAKAGLAPDETKEIRRREADIRKARKAGDKDDVSEAMDDYLEALADAQIETINRVMKKVKGKVGKHQFMEVQQLFESQQYSKAAELAVSLLKGTYVKTKVAGEKPIVKPKKEK